MARTDEQGMTPEEIRTHRIVQRNLREREQLNKKPKGTNGWAYKPLVAFPTSALDKVKVGE